MKIKNNVVGVISCIILLLITTLLCKSMISRGTGCRIFFLHFVILVLKQLLTDFKQLL